MSEKAERSSHQLRAEATLSLYERAKEIIPGATQLLSKRAEMFAPGQWPAYYDSASGVTLTDIDGNEYVDMSYMGLGSCILGYANDAVDARAKAVIDDGVMSTLNPPEEVELAEKLIGMHPWADMVRFGRPGGEAVAMAVRLARAYSGAETVAFCGYHGWHDWYLAANLESGENLESHLLPGLDPAGVPQSLEGTSKPFEYNDLDELERIARENDLGAIVMEPIRYVEPEDGFLEGVREIADEHDAPLVVDEITAGFRERPGGYHEIIGLEPDVAIYGKALANGYPMAAVVGKEHVMDTAQRSFMSSTFWTERIGPAATLETIRQFEDKDVHEHLVSAGRRVARGWEELGADHGLTVETSGLDPLSVFTIDHEHGQAAKTLFVQEMLDRDYLASNAFYASYAHDEATIDAYLEAVDEAFAAVATALDNDAVHDHLRGPVAHTKFERLN